MRKFVFIFTVLVASTFLGACSSDDGLISKDVILPASQIDKAILDFFNAELPELHQESGGFGGSKSFFYDPDRFDGVNIYENFICVINSRQELADIYLGEKELPDIDFDKYTLIIGQQIMPYLGFYVSKKELLKEDGGLKLNIYARHDSRVDENLAQALQILSFWGFYPKLVQKDVSVNVIREFPNR